MVRNSMNCGRTSASVGSMSPARITANITDLPRNLRCARAKPIIEHTTTVEITDSVEMMKLFRYHQPIGFVLQVLVYACKVQ